MKIAVLAIGLVWAGMAGAEALYRLPWPDGLSFMFTQVHGGRITTHFTKATLHAVDIAMPAGVPVLAARAGIVEALEMRHAPDDAPITYEGNFVRVRHADGSAATYAHLKHQRAPVAIGEEVNAGQLLGYSGASGDVLEPHLHFVVTRMQKNSAGWSEEISLPVKFYVGTPPIPFDPRPALIATANYASNAEAPAAPSERRFVSWQRPAPQPGDEARAWAVLTLWLVCGVAALAWFWRFAR